MSLDQVSASTMHAKYRPMLRLLDESDMAWVASSLGQSAARHLRAERRSLFRAYLRELAADHKRVVDAIKQILVESDSDRPELAKVLCRCQVMFVVATTWVESKLFLHALGVSTVDVTNLIDAVERLHTQWQDMLFVQAVTSSA